MDNLLISLFSMDERFIMHRYKSTRLAMIVGLIVIGTLIFYNLYVNDQTRWDLLVVVFAMALSKIAAMLYYHYMQ